MQNKVTDEQLYGMPYYEKGACYSGSLGKMRYHLERINSEHELFQVFKEDDKYNFLATIWWGEYCYEKTPVEDLVTNVFPFDTDGKHKATLWINEQSESK